MSENKEIEVISGDGSNLNISSVKDHIPSLEPKGKEYQENIVIPDIKEINIKKKTKKRKRNKSFS